MSVKTHQTIRRRPATQAKLEGEAPSELHFLIPIHDEGTLERGHSCPRIWVQEIPFAVYSGWGQECPRSVGCPSICARLEFLNLYREIDMHKNRLIRHGEHLARCRKYIAMNPRYARLSAGEYISGLSASNYTVSVSGAWIYYSPPASFAENDSFTFSVTNAFGGEGSGTVVLLVQRSEDNDHMQ